MMYVLQYIGNWTCVTNTSDWNFILASLLKLGYPVMYARMHLSHRDRTDGCRAME